MTGNTNEKTGVATLTRPGTRLFTTILFLGFGMFGFGLYLLLIRNDIGLVVVTEGVAFITIGLVGIRMFLTTKDVAEGIKEEIRTSSAGIKSSIDNMAKTLTRIEKLLEDKK